MEFNGPNLLCCCHGSHTRPSNQVAALCFASLFCLFDSELRIMQIHLDFTCRFQVHINELWRVDVSLSRDEFHRLAPSVRAIRRAFEESAHSNSQKTHQLNIIGSYNLPLSFRSQLRNSSVPDKTQGLSASIYDWSDKWMPRQFCSDTACAVFCLQSIPSGTIVSMRLDCSNA